MGVAAVRQPVGWKGAASVGQVVGCADVAVLQQLAC